MSKISEVVVYLDDKIEDYGLGGGVVEITARYDEFGIDVMQHYDDGSRCRTLTPMNRIVKVEVVIPTDDEALASVTPIKETA